MVNATAMPTVGWEYLNNTANFNIIKASQQTWINNPVTGNFGWLFASLAIVLFVPAIIYVRSQNLVASIFALIMITNVASYYDLLYNGLLLPINIFCIIGLAVAFAHWIKSS